MMSTESKKDTYFNLFRLGLQKMDKQLLHKAGMEQPQQKRFEGVLH